MADKKRIESKRQRDIRVLLQAERNGTIGPKSKELLSQLRSAGEVGDTRATELKMVGEEGGLFGAALRRLSGLTGEFGVPIAGAIAGAERGRRLAAPLGPRAQIGGAAIGAGIGAFGGSLAGEASLGRKPDIARAAEFGTISTLGEVIPGISRAIRPRQIPGTVQSFKAGSRAIDPDTLAAATAEAERIGVPLSRAQRTLGEIPSNIENILRRALFFAKGRFTKLGIVQNKKIQSELRRIARAISDVEDEDVRFSIISGVLKNVRKRAGAPLGKAKEQLFSKIGSQQAILKRSEIDPLVSELARGLRTLKGRETFGTAQAALEEIVQRFNKGSLSVRDADTIISQIFDLTSSGQITIGKGALQQANKELFNSIGRTAKTFGALKEFSEFSAARTVFREVSETLESSLLKQVTKLEAPEQLGRLLARPGVASRIGKLDSLLSPREVKIARRSFLEFIVDKVTKGNVEDVSPGVISKTRLVDELDNIGDAALKKIFPLEHLSDIKLVARVSRLVNLPEELLVPPPGQAVSLLGFAQGVQLSAFVGGVVTGAFWNAPTGALIAGGALMGPGIAARLLANPRGVELITRLARIPAHRATQKTAEIILKMNNLLAVEEGRKLRLQRIPSTIP